MTLSATIISWIYLMKEPDTMIAKIGITGGSVVSLIVYLGIVSTTFIDMLFKSKKQSPNHPMTLSE